MRIRASLALAVVPLALAGCSSHHFTGHSGTCRYGLGAGASGLGCYRRPDPSAAQVAAAATAQPMTRALATFKSAHRAARVTSVGLNWWAETTFTIDTGAIGSGEFRMLNYDEAGQPASTNEDGLVYDKDDAFSVGAVRPHVLGRIIAALRSRQPGARFLRAIVSVNPFSKELQWRVELTTAHTGSAIDYVAAPDGSALCHGTDWNAGDDLHPVPGIPKCAENPFAIKFTLA